MIASCWIIGSFSKSYDWFLYDEDEEKGCRFLDWPSRGVQAAVGLYTFIIQLIAPFIFMIVGQWKVISTLKRQVNLLSGQAGESLLILFTMSAGGVRPVVSAGGVRPVVSAGGVRPVVFAGGVRPVVSTLWCPPCGVRPVVSAGGVRPVASAGGVRPVVSAGGVRPVVFAGGVRRWCPPVVYFEMRLHIHSVSI